jgi:hypothetical protein
VLEDPFSGLIVGTVCFGRLLGNMRPTFVTYDVPVLLDEPDVEV